MSFAIEIWLGICEFFKTIVGSPPLTFFSSALFFFFSIFVFAYLYLLIHSVHKVNITRIDGLNIQNAKMPIYAFEISDSLKKKYEIKAKNDLLVKPSIGGFSNYSWGHFTSVFKELHERSKADQKEGEKILNLSKIATLGITATELVENTFHKYPNVTYVIDNYIDNSFETIFPALVLANYKTENVGEMLRKINEGNLTPEVQAILTELKLIMPKLKGNILENKGRHTLFDLTRFLTEYSRILETKAFNPEVIRESFYAEILSIIATGTDIKLEFDNYVSSLNFPDFWDLLQISATIATTNTTSDLVPITNDARAVMWVQLILSYFILALNIAALTKLLNLS